MDPLISLDETHVDLWLLDSDAPAVEALLPAIVAALLPHERPRYERIVVQRAKREYALTRVLLRGILSRYARVPVKSWRFGENEHGRPHVESPALAAKLDFNLSHTAGRIACLVGRERVLGVDVEAADRVRRTLDIAERFFSPLEAAALRARPQREQSDRFLAYWTLKEAYIKAKGMGLALPLHHFSFHLDEGDAGRAESEAVEGACSESVHISFAPELDDDPQRWRFMRLRPSPRHQLAIALQRRAEEESWPTLRQHDALPLLLDRGDRRGS